MRHGPELLVCLALATLYALKQNQAPPPPQPRGWNVDGLQPGMTYAQALRVHGLPVRFYPSPERVEMHWGTSRVHSAWFLQSKVVLCFGQTLYRNQRVAAGQRISEAELGRLLGRSHYDFDLLAFPQGILYVRDEGFMQTDAACKSMEEVVRNLGPFRPTVCLDGLQLGTRAAPRNRTTRVHYTASGFLDQISGTKATWDDWKQQGVLKVGDPAPTFRVEGLTISVNNGKVIALEMQVQDPSLIEALDKEATYRQMAP